MGNIVDVRPASLGAFVGQVAAKDVLRARMMGAERRGEQLPHVLLGGPPGTGKTTLAHVIAHDMGYQLVTAKGATLSRVTDTAGVLASLPERSCLFIDEIHRLTQSVQEELYTAMEDGRVNLLVGDGPDARTISVPLPKFTLIGATTRAGRLCKPLYERFGIVLTMEPYTEEQMRVITRRALSALGVGFDVNGPVIEELAALAGNTPRRAVHIARVALDVATIQGASELTQADVPTIRRLSDLDESGLMRVERAYMAELTGTFDGGPVSLHTLSDCLGEEPESIEDGVEPELIRRGLLKRTHCGRVAGPRATGIYRR